VPRLYVYQAGGCYRVALGLETGEVEVWDLGPAPAQLEGAQYMRAATKHG
jgi:hypothetical protein